ncbi:MAG: hypothetical protein VB858_13535 [Planctomycetaceae bacterium]|jgi:hypothetical protein
MAWHEQGKVVLPQIPGNSSNGAGKTGSIDMPEILFDREAGCAESNNWTTRRDAWKQPVTTTRFAGSRPASVVSSEVSA